MTALDTAIRYIRRRWNPVPVPHRAKKPVDDGWQNRIIDEASAPRHFNGRAQNVGIILGPSSQGLTDVDLDCREAIDLAPYFLPKTDAIFGRASKPASHWLYYTSLCDSGAGATIQFKEGPRGAMLVELRIGGNAGAQTIFPGSTHESGEPIDWTKAGEPAKVDGATLRKCVTGIAIASLLVRHWPAEGSRHEAAKVVGGFLARAGWSPAEARHVCGAVASVAGDREAKDREKAAHDAAEAFQAGKNAYGFPKLKEFFGDDAAKQIATWLNYREVRPSADDAPGKDHRKDRKKPAVASAADLRRKEFPPIRYVVPGYIAEGCTLLAGRPKLGKSWLMLDVGLAVAAGRICLGESRCEQGDILYLALEDNERRLQRRIDRVLGTFGVEWPAAFQYATEWPRANEGGLEAIREWIEAAENPRLVVVDVLAMFKPVRGDKESLYEADYNAIKGLQALAGEFNIAIVVVHHTRKSGGEHDPFEKVSGTLGLSGAADTTVILDRDGNGATLYGRGRDVEEIEAAVSFDRNSCRWSILGEAAEVRRSDERTIVLNVLREADEPMTPKEIMVAAGLTNRNAVDILLYKMAKAGEVEKAGRGLYCIPGSTPGKNGKMERSGEREDDGGEYG